MTPMSQILYLVAPHMLLLIDSQLHIAAVVGRVFDDRQTRRGGQKVTHSSPLFGRQRMLTRRCVSRPHRQNQTGRHVQNSEAACMLISTGHKRD
jgi:hypothetical protein